MREYFISSSASSLRNYKKVLLASLLFTIFLINLLLKFSPRISYLSQFRDSFIFFPYFSTCFFYSQDKNILTMFLTIFFLSFFSFFPSTLASLAKILTFSMFLLLCFSFTSDEEALVLILSLLGSTLTSNLSSILISLSSQMIQVILQRLLSFWQHK